MNAKKFMCRAYKINEAIICVTEADIPAEEKDILIKRLNKTKKEILKVIKKVNNPENLLLLIERYLNFKKWNEIAKKIGYSEKWTKTELHRRALSEVEEVLTNDKKETQSDYR